MPITISYTRNMAIFVILTITFILAFCAVSFASYNAGLPNAIFRVPAGAWASGMGGAVSANPDYMISWYNPSRLPNLKDDVSKASFGGGLRSLGRTEAWASYDFRVPPRVGMGVSFVYRGDPFISGLYDGYYSGGEVVEERPLDRVAWTAVSVKTGAGYLVSRQLSVGGSVAVNYQSLPTTPTPQGSLEYTTITSIGAFDIAASYRVVPNLILSASIKNLLSRNSWHIRLYESGNFSPITDEVVPPIFVLSSSHKTELLERELIWGADAAFFLFDGEGAYIKRPEMALAAGAQWEFTDELTLRAGLADLEFSGDIYRSGRRFREAFSPRITAGFSYRMSLAQHDVTFNYAITTDRIWAGIDQQVDITVLLGRSIAKN